jgi:hypothetical protein
MALLRNEGSLTAAAILAQQEVQSKIWVALGFNNLGGV